MRSWKEYKEANLKTVIHECEKCNDNRKIAEKFLDNIKEILQKAHEPLEPIDSLSYNKCYEKVLRIDADRHKDGDMSMFEDIRKLRDL